MKVKITLVLGLVIVPIDFTERTNNPPKNWHDMGYGDTKSEQHIILLKWDDVASKWVTFDGRDWQYVYHQDKKVQFMIDTWKAVQ